MTSNIPGPNEKTAPVDSTVMHAKEFAWADDQVDYDGLRRLCLEAHLLGDGTCDCE